MCSGIVYRIRPVDPAAHLYEIRLEVERPDPAGQCFALPAWIPGSYLVRDFARHIVHIEARTGTRRVALAKLDKHTWQARPVRGLLVLTYRVYAWDLSVRGAHLDATHGFFNGTSVFLRVIGREGEPCTVDIEPPKGAAFDDWRVATGLARHVAPEWGFGRYGAASYDELIDHPVEMGRFSGFDFEAGGARHHVVLTGRHDCDPERLRRDLAAVCAAQARLFEPDTGRAPFDRYLFLTTVVGDGYGGLEHRASTALICARRDLPYPGMHGLPDGYRKLLGLASHEYFHSWHVKRVKPQVFARYDLERENYTRLLWIFEGFTSYYDDLMLARAGVIDAADYLKALSGTIGQVLRAPGRLTQSVADSSFDAWTKYYRQDENSPNAIVSYYAKGALVALCLDLLIRTRTAGRRSLDDAMRLMWQRFGRGFDEAGQGLPEDGFPAIVLEATGLDLSGEIAQWTQQPGELPLADLLKGVGVRLDTSAADGDAPWLGLRTATRGGDLTLTTVLSGGPAHRAGLSAGDVIFAANALRVDEKSLKAMAARHRAGDCLRLHVFRRDELHEFDLRLEAAPQTEPALAVEQKVSKHTARLRNEWMGTKDEVKAVTRR